MLESKRERGQYYTTKSPFKTTVFKAWKSRAKKAKNQTIIEPFAGCGNIKNLLKNMFSDWALYDLEPTAEDIIQCDTLKNFPTGYDICITNPPYIAKNSAKRLGLEYPVEAKKYIDLYLFSLEKILNNCQYCAAIIPASFLTQELFLNRLYAVDLITDDLFEDTDVPVCVAYFVPEGEVKKDDFIIYEDGQKIDSFKNLKKNEIVATSEETWKFNDPTGWLGLYAVDGTTGQSIRFVDGNLIKSDYVKVSCRSITRISGPRIDIDILNSELETYRQLTHDVFLTTFKGKRNNNKHRRRLDYATARKLLNHVLQNKKG